MRKVPWYPMTDMPTRRLVLVRFAERMTAPFEGPNIWSCWKDDDGVIYGDHHSAFRGTDKSYCEAVEWTELPE